MKYAKESYITSRPDPELWKEHVNIKTLNEMCNYITGNVLDVGCNHGSTTYWLKDLPIESITGIDINNNALECAKHLFKTVSKPSKFINLDLTTNKLNEIFNTIVSFHTLEHIYPEDVDSFLANIYSMLDVNGCFIISIPYETAYKDSCHVAFYNVQKLNEVMYRNNFKVIKCYKDDRWNEKNILTGIYKK
jgi:2-polyprenyl-3-methyl-5-hydroxy-6-metoxy-1,4-benzoquinol methylase